MVSAELKSNTAHIHQQLEKELVLKIKKISKPEEYVDLLILLYGFYHPLENKLAEIIENEDRIGPYLGRTSHLLLNDMTFFHPQPDHDIPLCRDLPLVEREEDCLGALYVKEGSTLGGRYIVQMISKKLDVAPDQGFTFFQGYGAETQARWTTFQRFLDGPRTREQYNRVLGTAINTFSCFNKWITGNEQGNN